MKVPSAADLALHGLARTREVKGQGTFYEIGREGHEAMGAAMRENARLARERGDGEWTQPPNNGPAFREDEE